MAFATADDVATRLGRSLTDAEEATAEQVIALATGLIADEVDRDAAWAEDLDPVPEALKGICVEKAKVAVSNPSGAAAIQEAIGSYSYSRTAPRSEDGGVFLTEAEGRIIRQAVYGTSAGSSSPRALPDRMIDLAESRDVDEPA